MPRCVIHAFLLLTTFGAVSAQTPEALRDASVKAVSILQKSAAKFRKEQPCASCHHNGHVLMALGKAREKGVAMDEGEFRALALRAVEPLKSVDQVIQGSELVDVGMGEANTLVTASMAGLERSWPTAALTSLIGNWQQPGGYWTTFDIRPPQSSSRVTTTALSLRALSLHAPEQERELAKQRIARGRAWLTSVQPANNEEATFRLLGLTWTDAPTSDLRAAAKVLLDTQQSDGGWSQLNGRPSDAYATGQALAALSWSGMLSPQSEAYRKGAALLLKTQAADGSWLVRTRMLSPARVSPPYSETGFPYGKDQFVSVMGTAWAAIALMEALTPASAPAPQPLVGWQPPAVPAWTETALFGSAEELRKLLDGGLNVNAATPGGTTVLMMAARNPARLRLLLERGADPKAKAKSGFTALTTAAYFRGNAASVQMLLDHGVEAKIGTGVRYGIAPLLMAAYNGDSDAVKVLLDNGAQVNKKSLLIGQIEVVPATLAAATGDAAMLRLLLSRGADPSWADRAGLSLLNAAVLGNQPEVVTALMEAGAKVNGVDVHGYTPLMYAAAVPHGDTRVADLLIKAGADLTVRAKDGSDAVVIAKKNGNKEVAARLLPARAKL